MVCHLWTMLPKMNCFLADFLRSSLKRRPRYGVCLLPSAFISARTASSDRNADSHTTSNRYVRSWCVNGYGSNEVLELMDTPYPSLKSPTDVIVRVHAASVNPIDLRMREGYGAALLNTWRRVEGVPEFPLRLGRDFSGVVVKTGRLARRFRVGDEVWGTPRVIHGGTHTEYLALKQDEISLKPTSLSHVEAASLPYVACTSWVALVSRAALTPESSLGKRILILGGSGGIGTFSIQLLKAFGAHVTTTCSPDAVDLVSSLGADQVVDYTSGEYPQNLEDNEGFDVILDPFGGDSADLARIPSSKRGTKYISLAPPVLPDTDSLGVGRGLLATGGSFVSSAVRQALCSGTSLAWAFFQPNAGALNQVRILVESGKIRPVVQTVFPFEQCEEAYRRLAQGHARGKIAIQVIQQA